MAKKESASANRGRVSAQPRLHQKAREFQSYGTVEQLLPLDLAHTSVVRAHAEHGGGILSP